MARPSICIGVPTLLREEALLDTIRYVLSQEDQADEIIIADQTEVHSAFTSLKLQEWASQRLVRILALPTPSLTGARNQLLRAGSSEYVLFIDDDVILDSGFVARYRSALAEQPSTLLSGRILEGAEEGALQRLQDYVADADCAKVTVRSGQQVDELVRGGNLAVNRRESLAIGGFDESFEGPAHGEESDFARRLLLSGYSLSFADNLALFHRKIQSGGCRVAGNPFWLEWQKPMNLLLICFRYPEFKRSWLLRLWAALRAGPLLRENLRADRVVPSSRAFARAVREAWKRRRVGRV